jgi:hypothetical protein
MMPERIQRQRMLARGRKDAPIDARGLVEPPPALRGLRLRERSL